MDTPTKTPGQVAYEALCAEFKRRQPELHHFAPPYNQLPDWIQGAHEASAEAVLDDAANKAKET